MIARDASKIDEALQRIERDDGTLQAWAFVLTSAGDAPLLPGPLSGVPFGVKDIIDVAKMPTALGLWREHRKARVDAWCVAVLRAAGAVPIGKTHTTAHAFLDPAPTLNPLDAERTPGGSSAGSAASVGAGHVAFALGTQTIGSVLRPAAYCGVVGFKPTFGRVPAQGVAPLAPSLDHVGLIGRDMATILDVAQVLMAGLRSETIAAPRIAIATSVYESARSAPETIAAVRGAIEKLGKRGCITTQHVLPDEIDGSISEAKFIMAYEAHASLAPLLAHALPPELHALLMRGAGIAHLEYVAALERREATRHIVNDVFAAYDAVIVPCCDAAPARITTGDGAPFAASTYYGLPAISIPIPGTRPAAVSLQLVAAHGEDARLLAIAARVEAALA